MHTDGGCLCSQLVQSQLACDLRKSSVSGMPSMTESPLQITPTGQRHEVLLGPSSQSENCQCSLKGHHRSQR